jgi:hypothetical protein
MKKELCPGNHLRAYVCPKITSILCVHLQNEERGQLKLYVHASQRYKTPKKEDEEKS